MKTFSEAEKTIARNINREYKWMARDQDGNLFIYEEKPEKKEYSWYFGGCNYIFYFNHLFSAIKWEDSEPTKISDIYYNPPILNDLEREYLKMVLKPFHGVVEYVQKIKIGDKEYLFILFSGNGALSFPDFDSGTRYSGMKLDRKYSLDELGITYKGDKIMNFDEKAIEIVRDYIVNHLDKSDPMPDFTVFTVWKCKVLQNWKYLLSSTLLDGMYYELTYNGDKKEWYLDAYKKFQNVVVKEND